MGTGCNANLKEFWTDDFEKFKHKVEPVFGDIDILAKESPDIYAHQVLSHGFMEYAGIKGLFGKVKNAVQKKHGSFDPVNNLHNNLYWKYLKQEYLNWAEKNNLTEYLEQGWEEFCND